MLAVTALAGQRSPPETALAGIPPAVRSDSSFMNSSAKPSLRLSRHLLPSLVLLTGGILTAPQSAKAVDRYWANTSPNFNSPASWITTLPGANDRGIFSAPLINPVLNAPITVSGLTFFAPGYIVSGLEPLTLGSGTTNNDLGAALTAMAAGLTTISAPLVLGTTPTGTTGFAALLGSELVVSGSLSGSRVLQKVGYGTVTISGDNTGFTGGLNANGGNGNFGVTRVNINSDTALGTGALTVGQGNGGSTIGNTSGSARTLANAVNIGAGTGVTSIFDLPANGTGDLTFTGQATLSGAASTTGTINVIGGTLTLRGGLTESLNGQSLTKGGSGTLVLGGVVNNTGAINYSGGAVVLDRSAGGTIANATSSLNLTNTNFAFRGATTGTSTQTLGAPSFTGRTGLEVTGNGGTGTTLTVGDAWTRTGGATLAINLSGVAALTSAPAISAGSLVIGNGTTAFATVTDANGTGFATRTGANVVRYTGATTMTAADSGVNTNYVTKVGDPAYNGTSTVTLTGGNRTFGSLQVDTSGGNGTLDLNGTTLSLTDKALLATGTNNFTIQNGVLGANAAELVIHQFSTGTLTISSPISNNSNSTSVAKDGPGTLILAGANLYTGATAANEGTLNITGSVRGNVTAAGSTIATRGTVSLQSAGAAVANTVAAQGSGVVNQTVANAISGTAAVNVNGFPGTATINLSRANNYSGNTNLNNGLLNLGDPAANGTGTLVFAAGVLDNTSGAAMTLSNNNAVTVNNSIIFTGTHSLNLGTGAVSLNLGTSTTPLNRLILVHANTLTIDGPIGTGGGAGTGNVGITKIGAGTLALGGANTYNGPTNLQGGVLLLNNVQAIPGGVGSVGGTANLNITGGVVGLGASDFRRPVGIGAPDVQLNGSLVGFAAFGADRVVNLGGSGATLSWGVGHFLTNTSGSVLVLGAPNADKMIDFQNPIILGTGTNQRSVKVDNGSAAIDARLSGAITSSTGTQPFAKLGDGTLELTADNTYNGTTSVVAGTLLVNGSIAGSASVNVAGGATLGGEGSITTPGDVTLLNSASLAPGSLGIGTLTADVGIFDLSPAAGGIGAFQFELGATGDKVTLTDGVLNIGTGVLEFEDFAFMDVGGLDEGTYTLFDTAAAITGTLGANTSGTIGAFAATLSTSSNGEDLLLTVVIPEPASAALLLFGVGLLTGQRRRHA
jgi:fibronectin-binding autotransporter adhesin